MKKRVLFLALALLLLLGGCRKKEPPTEEPLRPPVDLPPVEEPDKEVTLDVLRVELTRGTSGTDALAHAVKTLPGLLETYFAEHEGAEISRVVVTVGTSPAATAQALAAGSIDLAFLPAEDYLRDGGQSTVLYADADINDDVIHPGTRALLCAAPTDYGMQLAQRTGSGKPLSWQEVSQARWGVLGENTLDSYRAFDLWLSENYEGARVRDLARVSVYESEEVLFRAAAAGEIDALSVRDDARADAAELWVQTAEGGNPDGFGREACIWEEVTVMDVTARLYGTVVAAAPKDLLAGENFTSALADALERLSQEESALLPVLGVRGFAPVDRSQLEIMERLTALEG